VKIISIIPIKSHSERVKNKNFKKIGKKPLYKFMLEKVVKCNFDENYVDTDSNEIKEYCKKIGIKTINRVPKLALNNANGNDLLNYHSKIIDADIYFQLYITAPLLKISSINKCIEFLKKNSRYDSILTVKEIYSWFWFGKHPVNYKPKILPRSQDAKPIIQETTGLYGIRKKSLLKNKCRIGQKPFFYKIGADECIDLDTEEDFIYLNYYAKKYLSSSKS